MKLVAFSSPPRVVGIEHQWIEYTLQSTPLSSSFFLKGVVERLEVDSALVVLVLAFDYSVKNWGGFSTWGCRCC